MLGAARGAARRTSGLSRLPSESETAAFTRVLSTHAGGPTIALQDIFWAVLNSNEFIFNH